MCLFIKILDSELEFENNLKLYRVGHHLGWVILKNNMVVMPAILKLCLQTLTLRHICLPILNDRVVGQHPRKVAFKGAILNNNMAAKAAIIKF